MRESYYQRLADRYSDKIAEWCSRGWSMSRLADKCGVSGDAIDQLYRGRLDCVSEREQDKVRRGLGVAIGGL